MKVTPGGGDGAGWVIHLEERLFSMQPIPLLHWEVGETCRLFMRSLFINIQQSHFPFKTEGLTSLSSAPWHCHLGPGLRSVIRRQPGL